MIAAVAISLAICSAVSVVVLLGQLGQPEPPAPPARRMLRAPSAWSSISGAVFLACGLPYVSAGMYALALLLHIVAESPYQ